MGGTSIPGGPVAGAALMGHLQSAHLDTRGQLSFWVCAACCDPGRRDATGKERLLFIRVF